MSDKVSDWAEKAAGDLALEYVDWIGRERDADAEHVLAASVATALLSAYRRGVEDSAKVADEAAAMRLSLFKENEASINAHKSVQAEDIAAAIRRLGEAE